MKNKNGVYLAVLTLTSFVYYVILLFQTGLDGFMEGNPIFHKPAKIWFWSMSISYFFIIFLDYGKRLSLKMVLQLLIFLLLWQIHDIQYFYISHFVDLKYGYPVASPVEQIVLAVLLALSVIWVCFLWLRAVRSQK